MINVNKYEKTIKKAESRVSNNPIFKDPLVSLAFGRSFGFTVPLFRPQGIFYILSMGELRYKQQIYIFNPVKKRNLMKFEITWPKYESVCDVTARVKPKCRQTIVAYQCF